MDDFEVDGLDVKRAARIQGRTELEGTPARIKPGDTYQVKIYVRNQSKKKKRIIKRATRSTSSRPGATTPGAGAERAGAEGRPADGCARGGVSSARFRAHPPRLPGEPPPRGRVRRRPRGDDWELTLDPAVNAVLPVSRSALAALWGRVRGGSTGYGAAPRSRSRVTVLL